MTTAVSPNKTPKHTLALHEAVHQADLKKVVTLLAEGANPNLQADELQGCAPLHIACLLHGRAFQSNRHREARIYSEIAETLLKAGALVTLRDHQFRVPAALAEGFTPKSVREAMARKATAEPGVFDPSSKQMWHDGPKDTGKNNSDLLRWLMRDHPLRAIEPLGGGPLLQSDRVSYAEQRAYYEESQRRTDEYKALQPINAARAREEEMAAGRAALVRLGLGQRLVTHEVQA